MAAIIILHITGKCLAKLPAPPSTSPTTSSKEVDFWYPMCEQSWNITGCSNKLPLPYKSINDRPTYSTQLRCCKAVYGSQMTGACKCVETKYLSNPNVFLVPAHFFLSNISVAMQWLHPGIAMLPNPPTTSPTGSNGGKLWYPDYDSPWSDATCLNNLPLLFGHASRPTYDSNDVCCSAAYRGQVRVCIHYMI